MRIVRLVAALAAAFMFGWLLKTCYPELPELGMRPTEARDEIAHLLATLPELPEESPSQAEKEYPDAAFFLAIVANEMDRLGIHEADYRTSVMEVLRFIRYVKRVESDGDRYADAPTSTAMSFFQFTVPSVKTAVNRLKNYMTRHGFGGLPPWAVALRGDPHSLYDLSEPRQAILMFVNIVEQKGSDELLRRFLAGEREAAKALYYAHHHTDPDEPTSRRAERIFSIVFN